MRHIFPSFHYQRDIWRASQIRNSWVARGNASAGFVDGASWESIKRKGAQAIEAWIDRELSGTSVTVVLIGAETSTRRFVNYEIEQSYSKGKGLLGVYVHNMRDSNGFTDAMGSNPFDNFTVGSGFSAQKLGGLVPTFDWVLHDGYNNFGRWVESAARAAGR